MAKMTKNHPHRTNLKLSFEEKSLKNAYKTATYGYFEYYKNVKQNSNNFKGSFFWNFEF